MRSSGSRLGRRGQIVIPALFVLPSLMLFLYLIFETAKLSREKIRMQFALDTAAFIDLSNHADLLNRTAYVNGAFPARVFLDAFGGDEVEMRDETSKVPLLEILFDRGIYPMPEGRYAPSIDATRMDRADVWDIRYAEGTQNMQEGGRPDMNADNPPLNLGTLNVLGGRQVRETWIAYERAVSIWQLVSQIFSLLGSVYEAQVAVNRRLMSEHSFYKKSWMLNSGLEDATAKPGLDALRTQSTGFKMRCHYADAGGTYGFTIKQGPLGPYYTGFGFGDDRHPDAKDGGDKANYSSGGTSVANNECDGLFQFATVDQTARNQLRAGYKIKQFWPAPGNYFKVDVNRLGNNSQRPYVHVTTAVVGPKNTWPRPTPRFQTRQFP